MRLLTVITEPKLIYGIVIGVALSILGAFLVVTKVFSYGLLGLLLLVCIFTAGSIMGWLSAKYTKQKVKQRVKDLLPEISHIATQIGWTYSRSSNELDQYKALQEQFNENSATLKVKVSELAHWLSTSYMRAIALGFLFTMLGLLISFAIFWATFLQVSRLEEQIETTKIAKKIDIALSLSSSNQMLVNALINDISSNLLTNSTLKLNSFLYKRIESTFRQLKPYYGIDSDTATINLVKSSPEQSFLLQYLSSLNISFNAAKLSLAYLDAHKLDLRFTDFSYADFTGSNLSKSAFYKTQFKHANLSNSLLISVSFEVSDLSYVNFSGANLSYASLKASELAYTNFDGANLSYVDMAFIDDWQLIQSLQGTNISNIKNAPKGFIEWALSKGAIIK